jgi:casein kinase II subunit beta
MGKVYVPRIYGFKVSERARSGPRMKWLRERPERWEELDSVDWKGQFKGERAEGAADAAEKDAEGMVVEGSSTGGKKGKLFDEEEEEEEDDEEEEEEEAPTPSTSGVKNKDDKSTPAYPSTAIATPSTAPTAAAGTAGSTGRKSKTSGGKATTVVR